MSVGMGGYNFKQGSQGRPHGKGHTRTLTWRKRKGWLFRYLGQILLLEGRAYGISIPRQGEAWHLRSGVSGAEWVRWQSSKRVWGREQGSCAGNDWRLLFHLIELCIEKVFQWPSLHKSECVDLGPVDILGWIICWVGCIAHCRVVKQHSWPVLLGESNTHRQNDCRYC